MSLPFFPQHLNNATVAPPTHFRFRIIQNGWVCPRSQLRTALAITALPSLPPPSLPPPSLPLSPPSLPPPPRSALPPFPRCWLTGLAWVPCLWSAAPSFPSLSLCPPPPSPPSLPSPSLPPSLPPPSSLRPLSRGLPSLGVGLPAWRGCCAQPSWGRLL